LKNKHILSTRQHKQLLVSQGNSSMMACFPLVVQTGLFWVLMLNLPILSQKMRG